MKSVGEIFTLQTVLLTIRWMTTNNFGA